MIDTYDVMVEASETYDNHTCPNCGDFVSWDEEHPCDLVSIRIRNFERWFTPAWMM